MHKYKHMSLLYNAAIVDNRELMQYLYLLNPKLDIHCCKSITTYEWYRKISRAPQWMSKCEVAAARSGNPRVLFHALQKTRGFTPSIMQDIYASNEARNRIIMEASRYCSVSVFRELLELDFKYSPEVFLCAVRGSNVNLMQYIIQNHRNELHDINTYTLNGMLSGDHTILTILHDNGLLGQLKWSKANHDLFIWALKNGLDCEHAAETIYNIAGFEYLKQTEYTGVSGNFQSAIDRRDIPAIKWLLPRLPTFAATVVASNDLTLIELLDTMQYKTMYTIWSYTTSVAILETLRGQCWPMSKQSTITASSHGNVTAFCWLVLAGCDWDNQSLVNLLKYGRNTKNDKNDNSDQEIVQFLQKVLINVPSISKSVLLSGLGKS
jgi:hypothetical protein